jgi:hypothetical protein
VAARSKAQVFGHLGAEIAGSNSAESIEFVSSVYMSCCPVYVEVSETG